MSTADRTGGRAGQGGFDPAGRRTLLRFARPHRAPLILGIVLGALGSLAALTQPLAARATLTAVSTGGAAWPAVLILLDGGRVRTIGTHEDLIAGDALYRSLAAGQFLRGDFVVEKANG